MEKFIEQIKALGESNRFRIMMMLRQRSLCVCEMLAVLDISGATLSNHLRILKHADLVISERDGKWIIYELRDQGVNDLLTMLYEQLEDRALLDHDAMHLKGLDRSVCSSQG